MFKVSWKMYVNVTCENVQIIDRMRWNIAATALFFPVPARGLFNNVFKLFVGHKHVLNMKYHRTNETSSTRE